MADEAQVSVIVPVFNGAPYIAEALDSVRSQRDVSVEIIVIDDGSTDDTAKVVKRRGDLRYVRQANRGPAASRNTGLALAQAALVAFLDADDLWTPDKLRLQLPLLLGDSKVDAVTGHVQCLKLDAVGNWEIHREPRYLPLFGTLLARRSVFDRVGPLDESLRVAEDVDWFMRARESRIKEAVLPAVVLHYRLHGGNLTRGWTPSQAGYAHAVKKMLDKRRGARET